ncbi:MAG: hypothetical protein ACI90V_009973, partial [Bacillariaceae sp.]
YLKKDLDINNNNNVKDVLSQSHNLSSTSLTGSDENRIKHNIPVLHDKS